MKFSDLKIGDYVSPKKGTFRVWQLVKGKNQRYGGSWRVINNLVCQNSLDWEFDNAAEFYALGGRNERKLTEAELLDLKMML